MLIYTINLLIFEGKLVINKVNLKSWIKDLNIKKIKREHTFLFVNRRFFKWKGASKTIGIIFLINGLSD